MSPSLKQAGQAWAATRIALASSDGMDILARPDILDKILMWKMNNLQYLDRNNRVKGTFMGQRQWTIEARADFMDPEKNAAITQAIQEAAVHVHAVMALLSDGQKPQVVAFSDDFFTGHEDIGLHEDVIGKAVAAHGDKVGESEVSDELLRAAREMGQK